jgi:hypothetical protein
MFGVIGKFGIALGVGVFVAREVERKMTQRREDPTSFAETATAYGAGAFAAAVAIALIPPSPQLALADGTCECR